MAIDALLSDGCLTQKPAADECVDAAAEPYECLIRHLRERIFCWEESLTVVHDAS